MIRRIHWVNAAIDLDALLRDVNAHNKERPIYPVVVSGATIYKAYKTLEQIRLTYFGPMEKNIGTPSVDKLINQYVSEFYKNRDDPQPAMESNSLNSVLWFIAQLRLDLELSRSENRDPDYKQAMVF